MISNLLSISGWETCGHAFTFIKYVHIIPWVVIISYNICPYCRVVLNLISFFFFWQKKNMAKEQIKATIRWKEVSENGLTKLLLK